MPADSLLKNKKYSPKLIALIFNLRRDKTCDAQEEFDEPFTIESVEKELCRLGFKVVLLEQDCSLTKKLLKIKPDFVFNIAEGQGSSPWRESQVPVILEGLGIPYSGSGPLALGLSMDKFLTNTLLEKSGVLVPQAWNVSKLSDLKKIKNLPFKTGLIVKPRWEGSSKGIFNSSLVYDWKSLQDKVKLILCSYKQPALVEEFLSGDEITAAVCGNKNPRLLGFMRIAPKNKSSKPFVYSLEVKRDWEALVEYHGQDQISARVRKDLSQTAVKAFKVLGLRDIARLDFRLDRNLRARLIDVNPLPGLSPRYSDLPIMLKLANKSYSFLIETIVGEAFSRYGFYFKA